MEIDSSPSSTSPPHLPTQFFSCGWLYIYLRICFFVDFMTETTTNYGHVAKVYA